MKKYISILVLCVFVLSACSSSDSELKDGRIKVTLLPNKAGDKGPRWSPKGEKLVLTKAPVGMKASLKLGPDGLADIGLLMQKSEGAEHFDILNVDIDRDGLFGGSEDTILTCKPNESRGKMWSSFKGVLEIPFEESEMNSVVNPYPVSFWFVEDPEAETPEMVIRYSRRGWMEGSAESEFGKISVMVTERMMDGIFDESDSWAIAYDSLRKDLFSMKSSKGIDKHSWLGEKAFGIDSVSPSGRTVWLIPVDPQITRAEEELQNDYLAADRAFKRTGGRAKFSHNYAEAKNQAKESNKRMFLDFETTWCGPCKTMDQWVYTADTVINALKNLVPVKIDGDENKELVKKYKVTGYPTLIVLNLDGTEKARAVGYQSVAKTLILLNR